MKKHTENSVKIISRVKGLPSEVKDVALSHHERYDGSGYPQGLIGREISFAASLAAICDVFDAITSARCYKQALGTVAGLKEIYDMAGIIFEEKLAHDFIRFIGVYPLGSCVRLKNNLIGVVVSQTGQLTKPIVKIVYDAKKSESIDSFLVDLSATGDEIINYEAPEKINITPQDVLSHFVK